MGLAYNPITQQYTNERGQTTDETGKVLSNTISTTPAYTPPQTQNSNVAQYGGGYNPAYNPQTVSAFINNLTNQVRSGAISKEAAPNVLSGFIDSQFQDPSQGINFNYRALGEYQNALNQGLSSLSQSISTVQTAQKAPTINRNLAPGDTGTDVKQLQEWLKSQGYFPADQPTTTTYGPITQDAVTKWQKANNINTQGNYGYYGPISQAFATKTPAGSTSAGAVASNTPQQTQATSLPMSSSGYQITPNGLYFDPVKGTYYNQQYQQVNSNGQTIAGTTSGAANLSPQEVDAQLQAWGIDPNSVDPTMKSTLAAIGEVWSKQFESGRVSSADVQAAYNQALQDPDIIKKYGDALKIGQNDFNQAVMDYQSELTQGLSDYGRKFTQQNKELSEHEAAAGRALSGFREQAKQNLSADQSSIVESTRRTAQKAVTSLGKSFEKTFGTSATPVGNMLTFQNPLTQTNDNITYRPYEGITGSNPLQQTEDVFARRNELLQLNPTA